MYYFIGIKGTGMAALATMLYDIGEEVSGSDLEKHFFTEDELVKRGITILPFDKDNIKDNYTVIIGNAFLEDFPEVIAARSNPTCKCYRYHEFLGELMKRYKTLSVCGSHGKTTTTAMLAQVFSSFKNTGYLIGDGEGYLNRDSEFLCVESCEYRRHFLAYYPDYAIITNIEIDHVDYFHDEEDYFSAYQQFVDNVKEGVLFYGEDQYCRRLVFKVPAFSFGLDEDNDDFVAVNIEEDEEAVISLAVLHCFDPRLIETSLSHFRAPKRRFVIEEYHDTVFIDDYAHHPTEVKVTLESARKRYPDRRIIAVFKPHRASRVWHFAAAFKEALRQADEIYLLDFTSIDDKQDGVDIDIRYLAEMIPGSHVLSEDEQGAAELARYRGEVIVFMSSKDIYNLAQTVKQKI